MSYSNSYSQLLNMTEIPMITVFSLNQQTQDNYNNSLNNIIKDKQSSHTTYEETFVVGKKISLADIVLFQFLTDFFDNKELVLNAYENCDVLKAIVTNVGNLDTVKNWLLNRPQTPF